MLEVYGSKRFAVKLRNVGLSLYLFNGVASNFLFIFGGVGVKLEDMAVAYIAFVRYGKVGKLRL